MFREAGLWLGSGGSPGRPAEERGLRYPTGARAGIFSSRAVAGGVERVQACRIGDPTFLRLNLADAFQEAFPDSERVYTVPRTQIGIHREKGQIGQRARGQVCHGAPVTLVNGRW